VPSSNAVGIIAQADLAVKAADRKTDEVKETVDVESRHRIAGPTSYRV
jgi:hypothetical protein